LVDSRTIFFDFNNEFRDLYDHALHGASVAAANHKPEESQIMQDITNGSLEGLILLVGRCPMGYAQLKYF
jgi:hypothetical protein